MRGNVDTTIKDGGLGNSASGEDGIQLFVGTAEGGDAKTAYEVKSITEARSILKSGELLEFCEHFYGEFDADKGQVAPPIFLIKPETDIAGSIKAPVKTGTGSATAAANGAPTAGKIFLLEIILAGACGTATYRKSSDGGKTWSDEYITPASGSSIALGYGVNIVFTDAAIPADSFASGDVWTVESLAPGASTSKILEAIETQVQNFDIKIITVLGATDKAFWAACQQIRTDWEKLFNHYVMFLLAARDRLSAETVETYSMDMINTSRSFYGRGIVVTCAYGKSIKYGDYRSMLPALAAKHSAARVHESVGFVDKFAILTFSEIKDYADLAYKDSTTDAWLDLLDNNRLTVATKYDDYPGIFFAHANLMTEESSDYIRSQDLRTVDKVRRIVRQSMMRFIESPSHEEAGIGGLKALKADADDAVAKAMELKGDREISGHDLNVDPTQDVTQGVKAKVKIFKIDTMESIEAEVGYSKGA